MRKERDWEMCCEFIQVSKDKYTHKQGFVAIQEIDMYWIVGDYYSKSTTDKDYANAISQMRRRKGNQCEVVDSKVWIIVDKEGKRVPGYSFYKNQNRAKIDAYYWMADKFLCQNSWKLQSWNICKNENQPPLIPWDFLPNFHTH